MTKNIVVVGGGISGLAVIHFLNKKYAGRDDVRIRLIEQNPHCGGTIKTLAQDGYLFECGPNGFLSNQPRTLELIDDLGLTKDLISANRQAKTRYITLNHQLHALPMNPVSLFNFKPMRFLEKLRILRELLIPALTRNREQETVSEFARRRFGSAVARYFIDPMVSGIYAGDSHYLNLQASFPNLSQWEQTYGSVIKGMVSEGFLRRKKAELKSLRHGMGQLIQALCDRHASMIQTQEEVEDILNADGCYVVVTNKDKYPADELIVSVPAFVAGKLLYKVDVNLAVALANIEYAPIAVVGLVYPREAFENLPEGYGYLVVPDYENPVLGVLVESQVFENRAAESDVVMRVMMGGTRFPECAKKSEDELLAIACQEVEKVFKGKPLKKQHVFISYPRAIPQYETQYPILKRRIESAVSTLKNFHLAANYYNGVSMNDCVLQAYKTAEKINF